MIIDDENSVDDMKTLTHTDGGDSLSDFLANDPLKCEMLLDYSIVVSKIPIKVESERGVKVSLLLKSHYSTNVLIFIHQYFPLLFEIYSVTGWTQATQEGENGPNEYGRGKLKSHQI